jgi:hypothetical protein
MRLVGGHPVVLTAPEWTQAKTGSLGYVATAGKLDQAPGNDAVQHRIDRFQNPRKPGPNNCKVW